MRDSVRLVTAAILSVGSWSLVDKAGDSAAAGGDVPEDPDTQIVNLDGGHVVVYADGRVFRRVEDPWRTSSFRTASAPRTAPQPAPSGYETARLTDDGLASLWRRAGELGMFEDEPDYGDPMITDQATSRLTITTGEQIFDHVVYAPAEAVGDGEAQARRDRYAEFVETLVQADRVLDGEISKFVPWVPDAWVVSTGVWFEAPGRAWPLDETPARGDCVILPTEADQDTATGGYVASDGDVVVVDAALPGSDCAAGDTTSSTIPSMRRRRSGPGDVHG